MNRLETAVRARGELDAADTRRMYALYATYYAETSYERFAIDLMAKDYVIELMDGADLCGFSTLAVLQFSADGANSRAIFSGDTIINHRYWGEQVLAAAFCRVAGAIKASDPATSLYWFLITKGHRTYRYLGAFSREYYPRSAQPTPPWADRCIDVLARGRFGDAWKPELGIVRFVRSQGHLRADWTEPRPALAARPEVRFFLERNPGHASGDELCCLTELCVPNLRSYARRAFLEGYDDDPRLISLDRGTCAAISPIATRGARSPAGTPFLDPGG